MDADSLPVKVNRVTKTIGDRSVLLDVDLSVKRGEVFGLIGPDGAGKTTLFNILMGFWAPTSGTVEILGQPPSAVRKNVSYLTQKFSCYPDLTVKENVIYAGTIRGISKSELERRLDKYLVALGLARFADRRARDLSGGMKQKLALTCALVSEPQVLLLDEPSTGVDPVSRREFWDLLLEAGTGITTIISTPYVDEAERCDRIALINHGVITAVGAAEELKADKGAASVFVPKFAGPDSFPAGLAIEAVSLTKKFDSFAAVQNLTLRIPYGTVFGLLGANGAGKTTAIKMLCGLLPRTSGDIRLNGKNDASSSEARQQIGYMSQKFTLYDDLTIRENLEFYAGVYNVPPEQRGQLISEVLEFAQLQPYANTVTGQLPGGWKQRVALGASILHKPRIIFLDEPTSGMDAQARKATWALIGQMAAKGAALLVSTHYMDEAEHCAQVGFMADGRLILSGAPEEIKNSQSGKLFEIKTKSPAQAAHVLRTLLASWKVAIFAQSVHVTLESSDKDISKIAGLLIDQNIAVLGVEQIPFSLEDAFIRVISSERVPLDV